MSQYERKLFAADDIIFHEGGQPNAMYIIIKGEVAVIKEIDGKQVEVSRLNKDEMFGDMALIEGKNRSATIKAVQETECYVIGIQRFQEMLEKTPGPMQAIFKIMSARLRRMTDEYATLRDST